MRCDKIHWRGVGGGGKGTLHDVRGWVGELKTGKLYCMDCGGDRDYIALCAKEMYSKVREPS
jgi:hypothetical protein